MKNSGLPAGQTPSRKPASSIIRITSAENTAPSGRILPSRISIDVAGVTWSCSKVPAKRSLTTDTAMISVVAKVSTKPNVPLTMYGVPSSDGLNSAVGSTATPSRATRPARGARRRAIGGAQADPGGGREAAEEGLGVAGEHHLAAVVDDADLGGAAALEAAQPALEIGRDDDRRTDVAGEHRAVDLAAGREVARHERALRGELGDHAGGSPHSGCRR